jgi:hypothetical protein
MTTKEKPIIFSAESVKQILSGAKTQTRRVMKPQPELCLHDKAPSMWAKHCPFGVSGMRLWVREAFLIEECTKCSSGLGWLGGDCECSPVYRADHPDTTAKWKSPLFLPRRHSRLTLEITNVRCERLKDISDADLASEGYKNSERYENLEEFKITWDTLNFKRGFGWAKNPWVWCISFKKIESEGTND